MNKLKIIEKETDKRAYWLKLFLQIVAGLRIGKERLPKEVKEILVISLASIHISKINYSQNTL